VLRAAGGEIRLGCSVDRVERESVTLGDGTRLTADRVICALPVERAVVALRPMPLRSSATSVSLNPLIPATEVEDNLSGTGAHSDHSRDPRLTDLARFTHSPILGVHLTFDRQVMTTPHAVLVEAAVQWLFRKDEAGTKVHAVISSADEWMALDEAEIARRVLADMHAYLPASREANVISIRPVKEKRATFAPTPDVEAHRPAARHPTDDRGVILAGDYTDTGWPATMEGAARSGYVAAAIALGLPERSLYASDLPVAFAARMMGLQPAGA
jgi:protoporphyrinogen oxidase